MAEIRAICFDAFGTVVEITDKRRPYHALLRSEPAAAVQALTQAIGLRELSREIATPVDEARFVELEADLQAECASIRVRPDMKLIWPTLQRAGLKIAICSNLSWPYKWPLLNCLPDWPDGFVLSCEVGFTKPRREIYQLVSSELELRLSQILFVGDSLEADVMGPIAAGASAMPIAEFEASYATRPSIYAPSRIVKLFARIAAAKAG